MLDALQPAYEADRFLTPTDADRMLDEACAGHPEQVRRERIGRSEEGTPLHGYVLGRGTRRVSLIAGNHADEPVGPEFLRRLVPALLDAGDAAARILDTFRFVIVPHTNPDGEAANRPWRERWPDVVSYIGEVVREIPGRDMEFGFPDLRPENEAVAAFLRREGPFALHGSLHGMAFAEGPMLLIERHWGYRSDGLQEAFVEAVRQAGLRLHDHNRRGEKGFFYLGPGFTTTPEGQAMRTYFRAHGDEQMAGRFLDSSMEFVQGLGGDPLCYVTELPLFIVEAIGDADASFVQTEEPAAMDSSQLRVARPTAYLSFKERLPILQRRLGKDESIADELDRFGIRALDLGVALRLQLRILDAALEEIMAR